MSAPPGMHSHSHSHSHSSPFGPPQPGDRGPGLVALASVCMFLTTLFVGARMYRSLQVRRLRAEDALVLLSGLLMYSVCIGDSLTTRWGNGKHISSISFDTLAKAIQIPLVIASLIDATVACAKFSVGLTLIHLEVSRTFNIAIGLGIFLALAGNFQNLVVLADLCQHSVGPPTASTHKRCASLNVQTISTYTQLGANVVADVMFVIVPIVSLRKLKLSSRDRAALIFVLGFLFTATVVSVVKVASLPHFNKTAADITWANIPIAMCGIAEATLCIIAACLPCIRLLLGDKFPKWTFFGLRSVDKTQGTYEARATEGNTTGGRGTTNNDDIEYNLSLDVPVEKLPQDGLVGYRGRDDDDVFSGHKRDVSIASLTSVRAPHI